MLSWMMGLRVKKPALHAAFDNGNLFIGQAVQLVDQGVDLLVGEREFARRRSGAGAGS